MTFEERLIETENRLGIKFPQDYIDFIKIHEGFLLFGLTKKNLVSNQLVLLILLKK